MDSYYELVDLASGNMVEDYDDEQDAIEALVRVAKEHGSEAIATFALAHVQGSNRRLVAMQGDLVMRIEQEMDLLAPHRRTS
jgi:hypothetical protein